MNRDERLTRVEALPPRKFRTSGTTAIYPHEPGGGTWIAVNDHCVTFALLNLGNSRGNKQFSRGEIIPALIEASSWREAAAWLRWTDLSGTLPFRLIGIFGRERQVVEWQWDGWDLRHKLLLWCRRHWFSSGLSDERARRGRRPVFERASRQLSAGSLSPLRRLHRSHNPTPGPFSICVHRPDAATRSYTEVVCSRSAVKMRYLPGSPCRFQAHSSKIVSLKAGG